MLNCSLMKIFEEDSIVPSIWKWGYFICLCLSFFCRYAFRGLHHLKVIWLHKKSESVSSNFFACEFLISNNTMWGCFKKSSSMNLSRLAKLESNHLRRNCNSCHLWKSIFGIKSPRVTLQSGFFSLFVYIHCWCKTCERTMVIMPTTPVILCIAFVLKWEVMEHPSNMAMPSWNNPF